MARPASIPCVLTTRGNCADAGRARTPCASVLFKCPWLLFRAENQFASVIYPPPLTTESPTTHTTDQHHVPIDPRAAELMPIHAARLALTRSVTQKAVDPSMGPALRVRLYPPRRSATLKRSNSPWRSRRSRTRRARGWRLRLESLSEPGRRSPRCLAPRCLVPPPPWLRPTAPAARLQGSHPT